jgi:hypothetical protein
MDDNTDAPDTMPATFAYPKFLMSCESRTANPPPVFGFGESAGATIHGAEATIFVNRSKCLLVPASDKSKVQALTFEKDKDRSRMNVPH